MKCQKTIKIYKTGKEERCNETANNKIDGKWYCGICKDIIMIEKEEGIYGRSNSNPA